MFNFSILKIRKREGRIANFIYKMNMNFRKADIPYWRPLYIFLFGMGKIIVGIWQYFITKFYREPLFKSLCYKVGKHFNLVGPVPYVHNNLRIIMGDNVEIYGLNTSFGGGKIKENPVLEIGNDTFIGPGTKIGICEKVTIGNNCLIAARVIINDNDGHPIDWEKRRKKMAVEASDVKPVIIEDDAWIGEGCFIGKGVEIGRGAIVGARAVVTNDIPEFTIAVGNPAKVIREIK